MRPLLQMSHTARAEQVLEDAAALLARVGVRVEHEAARELLEEAGAGRRDGRLLINEEMLQRALASAPAEVRLVGRDGFPDVRLGGGERVSFTPGSAALHILDRKHRRRRPPLIEDCVRLAWVTSACDQIDIQSTALIPIDVPKDLADRYRLYVALLNSRKPVITGTFRSDGFAVMKQMLVAVRGSEQALRERPLAVFDCAPTPPLSWSELTAQALLDCAHAGIPAQVVSMPIAGATAPVTLREALMQHTAENLSGIVLHQLACPGAPVIFGGSPSAMDMRHGTTPMGAVETMLIEIGSAAVGRHLGLPTQAYMALSDAKTVDWQAGAETGFSAALAALSSLDLVAGPGMLDFELCQSLEKLVLDNEACRMARRLAEGIAPREPDPVALFESVLDQDSGGQFLSHPHTRSHHRETLSQPGTVIDRQSYGSWERQGGHDAFAAASAEVDKIVARGNPAWLDDDIRDALKELLAADAARLGLEI